MEYLRRWVWIFLFLGLLGIANRPAAFASTKGEPPPEAAQAVAAAQDDLEHGKCEAAIPKLQHAVELRAEWTTPHSLLAIAYQGAGHETEAMGEYLYVQEASWPCAVKAPDSPEQSQRESILKAEAQLCWLINKERAANSLPLLRPLPLLDIMARGHSEEMRDLGYFDHASPVAGHVRAQDRFFELFGEKPRIIAENLARRWGTNTYCFSPANIETSHEGLMESPGHRKNILWPGVSALGIGVAVNDKGDYWITEVFVQFKSQVKGKT